MDDDEDESDKHFQPTQAGVLADRTQPRNTQERTKLREPRRDGDEDEDEETY